MELLFILVGLVVLLLLLAAAGHALWLGLAGLWHLVFGRPTSVQPPAHWEDCPGCGEPVSPNRSRCAACGLLITSAKAARLRDLEAMQRQLTRFHDDGTLDAPTFERLRRDCQDARHSLLGTRRREPARPEEEIPVWRRLARLLERSSDGGDLTPDTRRQALAWYRETEPGRLAELSPAAQQTLARLLRRDGDRHGALRAYARLLKNRPEDASLAETAMEAAEAAAEGKRKEMARWFLKQALDRAPSPVLRQKAEELLRDLGPEEEILDVLPAEPETVPPTPQPPVISAPRRHRQNADEPPTPRRPAPPVEEPAAPVEEPGRPRRTLGEVLAAFMEERNILWGELVGGLLIVGCSVALVISLWERLEAIPYFPFLIFAGITAALFGAGLYTLHHWKLESTSRGLLVIALLLVPLNFVVLAGLSAEYSGDLLVVGTEVVTLAAFAGLVILAARVIVPERPRLLAFGMVGPAAGSLLVPRLLTYGQAELVPFLLLGCASVGCYFLACGAAIFQTRRRPPLQERSARDLLALLGLASFALAAALGFLVYRTGDLPVALQRLALPVALSGIPILAGGLLVYSPLAPVRRGEGSGVRGSVLPEESQPLTPDPSPQSTGVRGEIVLSAILRTAGSAVGLAGMGVMLAAVLLAWPEPGLLIAVCALNFAVLTVVAVAGRLPVAHAAALPCLAIAYLTVFHLAGGHLAVPPSVLGRQLLRLAVSPDSGSALIALVVGFAAVSEFFVRRGRTIDAMFYIGTVVTLALASLVLVTLSGTYEPGRAALVCGVYAVVALALNLRWRRAWLAYGGLILGVVATLWGVHEGELITAPMRALIVAVESLVLGGLAVVAYRTTRKDDETGAGKGAYRTAWDSIPARAWRDTAAGTAVAAVSLAADVPRFFDSGPLAATVAVLALTACTLAWTYRRVALTWVGSALLLAAILHALIVTFHQPVGPLTFVVGLLVHATATLTLGAATRRVAPAEHRLRSLLAEPLGHSGLLATAWAAGLLPFALELGEMRAAALYAGWLAALWLVVSWTQRRPLLFSLGQVAFAVAVLLGVTWWLEGRTWVAGNPAGLGDPRSLQAYGIALAAFSLAWMAVRAGLRRDETAAVLLEPSWPTVDRVVLGLVVVGQLVLAVVGALPGTVAELTPAGAPAAGEWPAALAHAYGPGAWGLLIAAALVQAAALWERSGAAALGLLLAAVTVPVLAAGAFAGEHAVASALRWGLGGCFLIASVPLWLRGRLMLLATALRIPVPVEPVSSWGRRLLVALAVAPVLLLTIIVALVGFSGSATTGPDAGSFFAHVGWVASNVLPLVLVSAGLVGYAVRDRLPGYAFAGGLVADVGLMGGYALHVILGGGTLDATAWVRIVQLGTLGASLWTMVWLIGRRLRQPDAPAREEQPWFPLRAYLETQLGLGVIGNAILLIAALVLLTFPLPDAAAGLAPSYPATAAWTGEAGMPLGWLALAMTAAAFALAVRRRRAHALGLLGLATAGLLACSVERLAPGWGYRTLMLAWAAAALAWVAVLGMLARRGEAVIVGLSDAAAAWVTAASVLVLLLGLKAAFGHNDPLWAAAAIGLVSTAGAGMAVQRRQEGWAFTAGFGVNLAASLLVRHFYRAEPFESWGIVLLQANAVASAAVGLLWLWWRRQVYGPPELRVAVVPLLGVQVALGLAANAVLILLPLATLVIDPGSTLSLELRRVGDGGGWLALVLATAAALIYMGRSLPSGRLPIITLTALAACILAACFAGRWDTGDWLSFHVLLTGWTVVGLAVPAVAFFSPRPGTPGRGVGGEGFWTSAPPPNPSPRSTGARGFAVGMALVALALRGAWDDPGRPYWSAAATLSVAVTTGALALWSRRSAYVYASSLLVNLVGFLVWLAWGADTTTSFLGTQALCLAVAAGFWSAVEIVLRRATPPVDLRGRLVPFSHVAVTLALALLGAVVAIELGASLSGAPGAGGFLAWAALVALVVALAVLLWDDRAVLAPAGLYAVGLLAVGLTLARLPVSPERIAWTACLMLAAYTVLTAVVARAVPHRTGLWFLPTQAVTALLVLVLSVWICVGFDAALDRLAGPLAVALLAVAAMLLVRHGPALPLRYATLLLGVVLLTEIGWAALDRTVPAVALHRNVLLMTALAVTTMAYGAGLAREAARWPDWAECGRRCGPILGVLAPVVLLAVLGQEFLLFNPDPEVKRTPMLGWAVAVVAAALVGLIAAQLRFALLPGSDPFGLSERRRTLYVYAAEILLVGLFLHVRLNVPGMFGSHFVQYWTFAVMGLAFLGVGLAELFQRRNLPVLSGPLLRTGLFLPLLPLLAFWVRPPEWLQSLLESRLPGTVPLLAALNKLPTYHNGQFDRYALVWFLLGVLYVVVALARRSSRYALFGALAANVGLWCLLYHNHWVFLVHPQLWLVPLALIVLVAEHLNRERLGHATSATLRYTGLGLLYLSSSADMFIAGLGHSLVLPMVLALLSVTGVLAGILLRVRAFLLLGVGFLGLVIFSMIWHAAVDLSQTWVWWASGIVLGLAILGLFALFEKRRNDVLHLMERIKEWD